MGQSDRNLRGNVRELYTIEKCREVASRRGGECLSAKYRNSIGRLRWRCAKGHEWQACLSSLVNIHTWCPECAGLKKKTLSDMAVLAHLRGGECVSSIFTNTATKLTWKCNEGHEWEATPSDVKRGRWCPRCSHGLPSSVEEARALAASRGGQCLSIRVDRQKDKTRWSCAKGHVWTASFRDVKHSDSWCPRCAHRFSAAERDLYLKVVDHYPDAKAGVRRLLAQPRFELDIWIPSLAIAVEFDGVYWHSLPKAIERDKRKDEQCRLAGIRLIRIAELDYLSDPEGTITALLDQLGRNAASSMERAA